MVKTEQTTELETFIYICNIMLLVVEMTNMNKIKIKVLYVKSNAEMRREEYVRLTFRVKEDALPDKFDLQRLYAHVATVEMFEDDAMKAGERMFAAFNDYQTIPFANGFDAQLLTAHGVNHVSGLANQKELQDAGVSHTSMSVGDVVIIETEFTMSAFFCDNVGWKRLEVTRDILKNL